MRKSKMVIAGLGLLALAGCGSTETTITSPTPEKAANVPAGNYQGTLTAQGSPSLKYALRVLEDGTVLGAIQPEGGVSVAGVRGEIKDQNFSATYVFTGESMPGSLVGSLVPADGGLTATINDSRTSRFFSGILYSRPVTPVSVNLAGTYSRIFRQKTMTEVIGDHTFYSGLSPAIRIAASDRISAGTAIADHLITELPANSSVTMGRVLEEGTTGLFSSAQISGPESYALFDHWVKVSD